MSEITNEYSFEELPPNNAPAKACYTGKLTYLGKISDRKERKDIVKIHKKINKSVKSFNEDTNYRYKELFNTRDNYCYDGSDNCYKCNDHLFLSCTNFYRYMGLKINPVEFNKYYKVLADIENEIANLYT